MYLESVESSIRAIVSSNADIFDLDWDNGWLGTNVEALLSCDVNGDTSPTVVDWDWNSIWVSLRSVIIGSGEIISESCVSSDIRKSVLSRSTDCFCFGISRMGFQIDTYKFGLRLAWMVQPIRSRFGNIRLKTYLSKYQWDHRLPWDRPQKAVEFRSNSLLIWNFVFEREQVARMELWNSVRKWSSLVE